MRSFVCTLMRSLLLLESSLIHPFMNSLILHSSFLPSDCCWCLNFCQISRRLLCSCFVSFGFEHFGFSAFGDFPVKKIKEIFRKSWFLFSFFADLSIRSEITHYIQLTACFIFRFSCHIWWKNSTGLRIDRLVRGFFCGLESECGKRFIWLELFWKLTRISYL